MVRERFDYLTYLAIDEIVDRTSLRSLLQAIMEFQGLAYSLDHFL